MRKFLVQDFDEAGNAIGNPIWDTIKPEDAAGMVGPKGDKGDSGTLDPATIPFESANPMAWKDTPPTTVKAALDRLATKESGSP